MKKIIILCIITFILIIITIFNINNKDKTDDNLTKVKVAVPTLT